MSEIVEIGSVYGRLGPFLGAAVTTLAAGGIRVSLARPTLGQTRLPRAPWPANLNGFLAPADGVSGPSALDLQLAALEREYAREADWTDHYDREDR